MNRPWLAALLVGTAATPPAVILAIPAPRPLDALLAWPLVVIDARIGAADAPLMVLGLVAGIGFTWLHYVLLARLIVWRAGLGST